MFIVNCSHQHSPSIIHQVPRHLVAQTLLVFGSINSYIIVLPKISQHLPLPLLFTRIDSPKKIFLQPLHYLIMAQGIKKSVLYSTTNNNYTLNSWLSKKISQSLRETIQSRLFVLLITNPIRIYWNSILPLNCNLINKDIKTFVPLIFVSILKVWHINNRIKYILALFAS